MRVCGEPLCSKLVKHGRCPEHTRPNQHQLSSTQRGYDYAWQQVVKAAIAKQPWCTFCLTTVDLTGDHIKPRKYGGSNDPSNCRVLCRRCNSRRRDGRRGRSKSSAPTD